MSTLMPVSEVVRLTELVSYRDGGVVNGTIMKQPTGSVTLFAFDAGQGMSEHTVTFDALVYLLEGEAEIDIAGTLLRATAGEAVLLPANMPHALKAVSRFKMMLTIIRP